MIDVQAVVDQEASQHRAGGGVGIADREVEPGRVLGVASVVGVGRELIGLVRGHERIARQIGALVRDPAVGGAVQRIFHPGTTRERADGDRAEQESQVNQFKF